MWNWKFFKGHKQNKCHYAKLHCCSIQIQTVIVSQWLLLHPGMPHLILHRQEQNPLQNSGHSILCPWIQQFSTNFPGYAASRMECNNPGNGNQISSFKVPEFTGKFVVILSKRMLVICWACSHIFYVLRLLEMAHFHGNNFGNYH